MALYGLNENGKGRLDSFLPDIFLEPLWPKALVRLTVFFSGRGVHPLGIAIFLGLVCSRRGR